MEPVRSPRNQRVVDAARLHRARARREAGLTLLEGPHVIRDAIEFGCAITTMFATPGDSRAEELAGLSGSELVVVTPEILSKVAGTTTPRGPVAVVRVPGPIQVTDGHALVLWNVGDPGNVGTLIRSAAAFGFAVITTGSTADVWSPKVLRAAAAGHFRTPIEVAAELSVADLKGRGWLCAALTADGASPLVAVPDDGRVAVLVGDEAVGLPDEVRMDADLRVGIPMPGGIESLNAAVAGSVAMYVVGNAAGRLETAD